MESVDIETGEIPLSRGLVGMIDEEDVAFVSQWKWYAQRGRNTFYVKRYRRVSEGPGARIALLARELLNAPGDMLVDHINGNGLDNRRCNLRLATRSQNARNQPTSTGSTSQFRGVIWHENMQRWQTRIRVDGRPLYLGTFTDEVEAARAYDTAARLHHGEFARLNFSKEQE